MPGFEVFGEEEKKEILEVLETGVLFRYEFPNERRGIYKVRTFEERFAAFCGCAHAQAVTSGTAALKVALACLGVGPGDEVITQGFTFVATWEAILDAGAVPVFTEIDATLNMDPADLEKRITPRTRAIIPVHMLGAQARIQEIMAVANRHGIPVIEDTAQSAGGALLGRMLGTFGRCGTFSFDAVKTMTCGEGGMIITGDAELWRAMSEYHDHGHDHVPNPGARGGEGRRFVGFNYRMMELQGAIGCAQLAKLPAMIAAQKTHHARLQELLARIPGISFREILDPAGDTATFLCFFLPDAEQTTRVNAVLREHGAGAIPFGSNTWHFYPRWEHLVAGATVTASGWPFKEPDGRSRALYDPAALPASTALMSRCLGYQIPVRLSEERLRQLADAIGAAARL
ncbi:MAG: DegT/DnrJ/EryC1/StrS family aminotransferase [Thermodesulfobacteriota bacterium]